MKATHCNGGPIRKMILRKVDESEPTKQGNAAHTYYIKAIDTESLVPTSSILFPKGVTENGAIQFMILCCYK